MSLRINSNCLVISIHLYTASHWHSVISLFNSSTQSNTFEGNLCGNGNVLNDSWNESITQDDICEIVSLKELIYVRDEHQ